MEHGAGNTGAPGGVPALRRVVISSGGLGYFEYEASVSGDARIPLSVRLDQVDDVLKSLVVHDDRGKVGETTLPGKAPASAVARDVPFDLSALDSEPSLLEALRGAEVRVEVKDGVTVTGRVVSVTPEVIALPNAGGTITRHRLTIAAKGAVRAVILEEVTGISLADPVLGQQLDTALAALLAEKERGRRTLMIHAPGQGERVVRIAYVVEVPLWKTSYRLVLPAQQEKTALLEGFAIVDNQSGQDWQDIDLTLVSGAPAAFHQALYQVYYPTRPEVPVEVGRVLPPLDIGVIPLSLHGETPLVPPARPSLGRCGGCGHCSGEPAPPSMPAPPAPPIEAPTQVVFRVGAVTLANGQSAMLPIVDVPLPAERVSLYQPETAAHNPLASVRIVNDRDVGLPAGAVTVYERAADTGATTYAGDARLSTLPPGESRILSFSIDQKVHIDHREQDPQTVTVATLAGGVLTLRRTERRTTVFTVAGAAREPRVVILEVPRLAGFKLEAPVEGVARTPDRYRIRVEVAAGATIEVPVTQARPLIERRAVAELSSAEIRAFVSAPDLPEATRAALTRVAEAQAAVAEKEAVVKRLEDEHARIVAAQARIRDNLKVVPAGGALSARYLAELSAQEDRLAALEKDLTAARNEVEQARRALAETIAGLHVG